MTKEGIHLAGVNAPLPALDTVSAGNASRDNHPVTRFKVGNHTAYFFNHTNTLVTNNEPVIGVKSNFASYEVDIAAANRGGRNFNDSVCRVLQSWLFSFLQG